MNEWNELLAVLDRTIGFPNKLSSKVKKVRQAYDNKKNEHVIWLEYRVRVKPGDHKPERPRPGSLLDAITRGS